MFNCYQYHYQNKRIDILFVFNININNLTLHHILQIFYYNVIFILNKTKEELKFHKIGCGVHRMLKISYTSIIFLPYNILDLLLQLETWFDAEGRHQTMLLFYLNNWIVHFGLSSFLNFDPALEGLLGNITSTNFCNFFKGE